jgi:hypothetical protein
MQEMLRQRSQQIQRNAGRHDPANVCFCGSGL